MNRAAKILLGLTAPALIQCTSLDRHVTLGPQDRVIVELTQPQTDRTRSIHQTLANEAVLDKDEFYSSRGTDQFTKVVSQANMQVLLDAFATAGFFDRARSQELLANATQLKLKINDDELYFARHPGMQAADRNSFTVCWTAFLDLYNATKAYRTGVGLNTVLEEHREQRSNRRFRK